MIAFGPVPSRRLGRSLGINNIPPKNCTYSCIYCQVGRTTHMSPERRGFHEPERIREEVGRQLENAAEPVDYLTFVSDGEPTLDESLGRSIDALRSFGLPVAVISNASLIDRPDVQRDLARADWVSLKVDSVVEDTWHRIDRPHRRLRLAAILEGIRNFADAYTGELVTETMLVEGVNDGEREMAMVAGFLAELKPAKAYLSIPTRPPAESGVRAPGEDAVNRAYQILSGKVPQVEYLTGYEGDAFASCGNLAEDLLAITAVHPMREQAVRELVERDRSSWEQVEELIRKGRLAETDYAGEKFYIRRWRR